MRKYEITGVEITTDYKEGDIDLDWTCKGIGFGHLAFKLKDGKILCNNEYMGKEFIRSVLNKLVDDCILTETKGSEDTDSVTAKPKTSQGDSNGKLG